MRLKRINLMDLIFFSCSVPGSAPLEPRAIARAPAGEGCPRCGGYVYAAEQMLALGKVSCNLTYVCQASYSIARLADLQNVLYRRIIVVVIIA